MFFKLSNWKTIETQKVDLKNWIKITFWAEFFWQVSICPPKCVRFVARLTIQIRQTTWPSDGPLPIAFCRSTSRSSSRENVSTIRDGQREALHTDEVSTFCWEPEINRTNIILCWITFTNLNLMSLELRHRCTVIGNPGGGSLFFLANSFEGYLGLWENRGGGRGRVLLHFYVEVFQKSL